MTTGAQLKNSANGLDLNRIEAVVFDFDGTLAHLNIDFIEMRHRVAEAAQELGLDLEATGKPYVLEAVEALANSDGERGLLLSRRAKATIEEIELEAAREGSLFSGARSALRTLARMGLKVSIITRNCRAAVLIVFPDILDYCDLFVPRDDVAKTKPEPEHLGLVLDRLALSPSRTLMVGDHPIDVATARNVGAWACGLPTGRMSREELSEADLICDDLGQMVAMIRDAREEA